MKRQTRTTKQEEIATRLAADYDIDAERILFLNEERPEEPWLSAEALITIARQSGNFQAIDESFDQLIEPLKQVVHRAAVFDRAGHTYTRSGVATIGERTDIDDHALAAGRAVAAALTAAGFNPLRPGSVVSLHARQSTETHAHTDEASSRNEDLKRIHVIAERKGLIVQRIGGEWDRTGYRRFLEENYGVRTAAAFNATERASLINALDRLPDQVVDEFAEVA